jgi:hypothetical protein
MPIVLILFAMLPMCAKKQVVNDELDIPVPSVNEQAASPPNDPKDKEVRIDPAPSPTPKPKHIYRVYGS